MPHHEEHLGSTVYAEQTGCTGHGHVDDKAKAKQSEPPVVCHRFANITQCVMALRDECGGAESAFDFSSAVGCVRQDSPWPPTDLCVSPSRHTESFRTQRLTSYLAGVTA